MELIAHRGCGAVNPENTVRAVRDAAERLPAVEVDVRRCASGELVCVHDATVDRVTDGSGRVADHTLAELRALDVQGSGERIPTLEEIVSAVPNALGLQVELKERGLGVDVLARLGTVPNARLSSFETASLREVQDGDVPTGYLFEGNPGENVGLARALGCSNVHPHWRTCAETNVVERARAAGLDVYAWGAETNPAAVEAARKAGADGITVDRPRP
ncbi:glycerophosphodiester phosphodiesterase family protein [Halomontanus rarus]|uniref:glycerophosphodiester phosphodiesterase family protein n=1 Tax=Halomontanus rarus TaxID=3034020 RepID=UPI001A98D0B0